MEDNTFNINLYDLEGVIDAPVDFRDYDLVTAGVISNTKDTKLSYPKDFRLTNCSDIYNQGNIGSCVAFSLAELKESQELIDQNKRIKFSPGFIYGNRSEVMEGMYVRDALKALKQDGVCLYSDFPFNDKCEIVQKLLSENLNLFEKAEQWKIKSYYRIYTLDEIKFTLMNVGPIIINVPVYDSWDHKTGMLNYSGNIVGHHAMLIIGWQNDDILLVQNSWGKFWGKDGFGTLKYGLHPITEMWAVTDIKKDIYIEKDSFFNKIFRIIKNLLRYIKTKLLSGDL